MTRNNDFAPAFLKNGTFHFEDRVIYQKSLFVFNNWAAIFLVLDSIQHLAFY